MIHAVHTTEHGEDIGVGAHPTEGPAGCTVVRMYGLHLVCQFRRHSAKGTTTQRLHHDTLDTQFLAFAIQVFCIGIRPSATTHRGVCPVEEVHLDLYEVPMIFIVVIQQPVKIAHITVI